MSAHHLTPMEDAALAHPTQEQRSLQATDALLRRHGFLIYSRPRSGDNVWELGAGGQRYNEREALRYCARVAQERQRKETD